MNPLQQYVDGLFARYGHSRRIDELKAEILGNLESKKADLIAAGSSEEEALKIAVESITNIDFLIDGNKEIYYGQWKLENVQWTLIAVLIGWILTIPLLLFHIGFAANLLMFLAAEAVGIYYLLLRQRSKQGSMFFAEKRYVNLPEYQKREKIFWILWAIFAVISLLATSALYFGSNIWFSRRVTIDGPYALAVVLIHYFVPLLTVIIPIAFSVPVRLIPKYEAGEAHEG